ncbi:hypothetical protein HAX54_034268, partial [Datura stramonium]|nr:hypothetical protein [Datura stramonium]
VHDLAIYIAQSCIRYQRMVYEKFAIEVPTFARYFATKLEEIYRMLGGRLGQEDP